MEKVITIKGTVPSIKCEIYIAGDINDAKSFLTNWVIRGGCVSIEPTEYIYTGGREDGMVIRFINYPRYPTNRVNLLNQAVELANALIEHLAQGSATVVQTPGDTFFISRRESDN